MKLEKVAMGVMAAVFLASGIAVAQAPAAPAGPAAKSAARKPAPERQIAPAAAQAAIADRPKLVVLLVVDQMRADYVDKFQGQWSGGLKRLAQDGAWFHEAAYPYAATETCVGHATISTGALPATHGMIANAWWDRESQKMVTCTGDPNVKNTAYAGGTAKGGDSAWRMRVPAFADELRFQSAKPGRVITFSLKARAAITMAGHQADAAAWFDGGAWETSSPYGTMPFIENYVKANPMQEDYGKSWDLSLPKGAYAYSETAVGAVGPGGWGLNFPHALKGGTGSNAPDAAFYEQWASSPFADSYLTKLAEQAVDQLGLGRGSSTDFLGISYSSVDYVGHSFGPRSWEIQDVLVRLDKDLRELFLLLDAKVGRYNYVVALSADHGVVPVPEDMQKTGADAGVLHTSEVQEQVEKALEPLGYEKPVARIANTDVYFAPGVYDRLRADSKGLRAAMDAIRSVVGVLEVYRAEEVQDWPETQSPIRSAEAASYFAGRSGDLLIVPKPYYLVSSAPAGKGRDYGTGHGTPYYYDQRVPLFLMGWGIQPGDYFGRVTPADIAPTLAELCGITLSSNDGRVLAEALYKSPQ